MFHDNEAVPFQHAPVPANLTTATPEVFEGPEKKLEVFFGRPASSPRGFRSFDQAVWSDVLTDAKCSILHLQEYPHFDAYLLSESSLFVYPTRVILKTCGTTTLILLLPKLLALAARIGAALDHVHYSHYRYKFPELQLYPHTSFETEKRCLSELLSGHIAKVHSSILGDPNSGPCWYALCTEPLPQADINGSLEPPAKKQEVQVEQRAAHELPRSAALHVAGLPSDVDDLLEVAMEGLPADVCSLFVEDNPRHGRKSGRELARSMTAISGIGALLPVAVAAIDDWSFSPCGYSMNAGTDHYYYTIHITPEIEFSYASFETNDPAFREPHMLQAVVDVFKPASATVTLTTRTDGPTLPETQLAALTRVSHTHRMLSPAVAIDVLSFASGPHRSKPSPHEAKTPGVESACSPSISKSDTDGSDSEAASEDTCATSEVIEL